MNFSSPVFIFGFLPIFVLSYYALGINIKAKNAIILVFSVFFYAWGEPTRFLILLISAIAHYRAAIYIENSKDQKKPLRLISFFIVADVAVLFYFKYTNFFIDQINAIITKNYFHIPHNDIPLLLGISFVTFHQISFLIDVYKGRSKPPRSWIDCGVYIFLFPQLIAGPIIRFFDIGSQIAHRTHTARKFYGGLMVFALGLAKKVLIADPVGAMADAMFDHHGGPLPTSYAWIGILSYTIQIYFDFSGYSEMAMGLGGMMGFDIPKNFNRPYISRSITEFWQRWHISLSNWMRLYLYIPLGGNRVSEPRMYLNLWIVFIASGFWHGASWTFVMWGAYYGFFLSMEKFWSTHVGRSPFPAFIRHLLTLLIVMGGWVLFRAPTPAAAWAYYQALAGAGFALPTNGWGNEFSQRGLVMLLLAIVLATQPWERWLNEMGRYVSRMRGGDMLLGVGGGATPVARFLVSILLIGASVCALISSGYTPFLYFRF